MSQPAAPARPPLRVALAWSVHLFTMTGVLWACLAIIALLDGRIAEMWLWLGIALLVDGIDGTLARRAEVKTYAPGFDGTALDILIDYLTWTFIPALFMYLHLPFGPNWVALSMFALICLSSVFCYCNVSLKTSDYYFVGFPAAWNLVAVVLWLLGTGATVNIIVTVVLAVLTVAPITFVHPFRVARWMPINIAASLGWVLSTAVLVAQHPEQPLVVQVIWWLCAAWVLLASGVRTAKHIAARRATPRA